MIILNEIVQLKETISKNDIDYIKKQLGLISKNFSRIKNSKDLFDANIGSLAVANQVRNFYENRLFGFGNQEEFRNQFSGELNDSGRELSSLLQSIFAPVGLKISQKGKYESDYYLTKEYPDWRSKFIPLAWDHLFSLFETSKNYLYSKLIRLQNNFINALNSYIEEAGGEILDMHKEDTYKIGDFTLSIIYSESDFENIMKSKRYNDPKKSKENITKALMIVSSMIKSKRLSFTLKPNIIIEYLVDGEVSRSAARYQQYEKKIILDRVAPIQDIKELTRVILHEIGHHIWHNFLPQVNKEYWISWFRKDLFEVSQDMIEEIIEAFVKSYVSGIDRVSLLRKAFNKIQSDLTKSFFQMCVTEKYFDISLSKIDDVHDLRTSISRDLQIPFDYYSKMIMKNAVTMYGNSSPEEAFSETFSYYIMNKPLTSEITNILEITIFN